MSKTAVNGKTEAKSQQLVPVSAGFSLEPRTFDEAVKYAELIAKSDMVPQDYKGKPGNVLIAVQYGIEIGVKPLQALQNIAVINGRPTVWGDLAMAVVQGSGTVEYIEETYDEKTNTATFRGKRLGAATREIVRTFSMEDAKKANLAGKQGPWTNYPKRMCQLRARAFGLRDGWADALKGMSIREEMEDVEIKTATEVDATVSDRKINPFMPKVTEAETVQAAPAAPAPEQEKKPDAAAPEPPMLPGENTFQDAIIEYTKEKDQVSGAWTYIFTTEKNGKVLTREVKIATDAYSASKHGVVCNFTVKPAQGDQPREIVKLAEIF